ncbi:MAG: hypothetical protein HZA88_01195 [Verrucomicrobia bacterium]|nr:hypothetical protein [Verrucomicrobiota bacterium]
MRSHGLSLKQATDFAIAHLASDAPPVGRMVDLLVESARSTGRRERTVSELRLMLRRFAGAFGERKLGTIGLDELSRWVEGLKVGHRTRLHNIVKIGQLYNFAIRRGWVDVNLARRLDRPRVAEREPGVFTVEEAGRLLKHAGRFGLLGYVAMGLFAGLRPEELRRLPADAVKVAEGVIVVGAGVAKRPSRGSVPIHETLAAWLPHCGIGRSGLAVPARNFRRRLAALREAAGIERWPHDGLRHSFGSYDFAMHGDADVTANRMRHGDKRVFHAHYKALVSRADAGRYWALRP